MTLLIELRMTYYNKTDRGGVSEIFTVLLKSGNLFISQVTQHSSFLIRYYAHLEIKPSENTESRFILILLSLMKLFGVLSFHNERFEKKTKNLLFFSSKFTIF